MSDEFVSKCECKFREFDVDNSGCLSKLECAKLMVSLGFPQDKTAEIVEAFHDLDTDNDDSVSKKEFLREMGARPHGEYKECDLRAIFKKFDTDQGGFLTQDEIKAGLTEFDHDFSDDEATKAMADADSNGDGKVNAEEFIKCIKELL